MAENLDDLTVAQLQEIAGERDISGRSQMNKADLIAAILADEEPPPVARAEYDRLALENATLRQRLQYELQGALGASQQNSPDPGVNNGQASPA